MNSYRIIFSDSLMHHGIKGQKWGVRRYQNEDGTYTEEGLERRRNLGNSKLQRKTRRIYRKKGDEAGYQAEQDTFGYDPRKPKQITDVDEAKNYYHVNKNRLINSDVHYKRDEFVNLPEGKRLKAQYDAAYDEYFDPTYDEPMNPTPEQLKEMYRRDDKFVAAEEKYLRASMEYSAKRIIEEYGDTIANVYVNDGRWEAGEDIVNETIKRHGDSWWIHAV